MIEDVLGASVPVFLIVTFILFGGAAFLTGQALALGWRPVWKTIPMSLLLGCGERFITWALFHGTLLSLSGYLIHTPILLLICIGAHQVTKARKMVSQYPWLYRRNGLFGWEPKQPAHGAAHD